MDLTPFRNTFLTQHEIAGRLWSEIEARYDAAGITVMSPAWISSRDLSLLQSKGSGAALTIGNKVVARNTSGPDSCSTMEFPASESSFLIKYAWDLLRLNEALLSEIQAPKVCGIVHEAANVDGTLILGTGSILLPGVYIEGTVVIGENCKIGPNCYIRGNTTIGDSCRIGQSVEIKNCLIGSKTNVGHLSYIGDSVLGDQVNLGAGTMTSNLRHDGKNHKSLIDGELIDTGRRKFGAIFGHSVHTGINTSVYPGRKLAENTTTLPGELVIKDKI